MDNWEKLLLSQLFGNYKKDWKVLGVDMLIEKMLRSKMLFDGDQNTYWSFRGKFKSPTISILRSGKEYTCNWI